MSALPLADEARDAMIAASLDAYPLEACGVVATDGGGVVVRAYACRNAAASSRVYEIDPRDYMAAEDDADASGLAVAGVWHSHTHTDAYPSPTDVAQAVTPAWHYLLVSLATERPVVRSYRIVDGNIEETSVVRYD